MKKLLLATIVVGTAIAGLILYLKSDAYAEKRTAGDIKDAAGDAYDSMNKHIAKVERTFDHALN